MASSVSKSLMAAILATIRHQESGNYTQPPNAGGASGAYQYIQSTWASQARAAGYSQYAGAPSYQAPPSIQDAVAAFNVRQIIDQYGSVNYVPLAWYYPAAIGNSALLNTIPDPQAGNTETPAQYQAAWLSVFKSYYSGKVPYSNTGITRPGGTSTGGTGSSSPAAVAVDAYLTSVTTGADDRTQGGTGFQLDSIGSIISGIPIIGSLYTGTSDIISGFTDFLKFVGWILNPITWLRAVEFLTGVGLMAFGIHVAVTSFKEATGPKGIAAIFGKRTQKPRTAAKRKAKTTVGRVRQATRKRGGGGGGAVSDAERIGLEG